ncbi:hypothetical protein DFH27DRAFT_570240 [Peziza echinospora]|nr:hypothetical protein DFH27DRAFT_570240 [Peziza echinospora]
MVHTLTALLIFSHVLPGRLSTPPFRRRRIYSTKRGQYIVATTGIPVSEQDGAIQEVPLDHIFANAALQTTNFKL